jgi:hypothetical protein
MSHFAKVENGVVTQVLRITQEVVDTGEFGDPSLFVQTSYNTYGNQHLLGGTPLRGNYAGIGYTYDSVNDVFIAPSPFASWVLNDSWLWEPPFPAPQDGKVYGWDETIVGWKEVEQKHE